MAQLRISVIVGSVREGRISLPIANWVMDRIAAHAEFDAELLDLAEWALPMFAEPNPPATGRYAGEKQRAWADRIGAADGYILVVPEYNHGMSAVLKNALDTVYAEWAASPSRSSRMAGWAARDLSNNSARLLLRWRWRRSASRSICKGRPSCARAIGSMRVK
jgi:multimeric flavodoxin WrbA